MKHAADEFLFAGGASSGNIEIGTDDFGFLRVAVYSNAESKRSLVLKVLTIMLFAHTSTWRHHL